MAPDAIVFALAKACTSKRLLFQRPLAPLLSRGLLCADRNDHATGRPLVYRPAPRLFQLLGAETLVEAQRRMREPAGYRPPGEALAHGTAADGAE
jgi:hypothetical protein